MSGTVEKALEENEVKFDHIVVTEKTADATNDLFLTEQ